MPDDLFEPPGPNARPTDPWTSHEGANRRFSVTT
jgi:hypothetical protein